MLLYIGELLESTYLQQLSDQLQQAICLVDAPDDPLELMDMVHSQYSHYMISIKPYEYKAKEFVQGLKQFIEVAEGKLMLLAVGMTNNTPVISELMYAGFMNIYFVEPENCLKEEVEVAKSSTTTPLVGEVVMTERMAASHEGTEPLDVKMMRTEPMFTGIMKVPDCVPSVSGNKKKPLFLMVCCIIIALLVVLDIGVAIYLVKRDETVKNQNELYVQQEAVYTTKEPIALLPKDQEGVTVPSVSATPSSEINEKTTSPPLTAVDGSNTVSMKEPTVEPSVEPVGEHATPMPQESVPEPREEDPGDDTQEEVLPKEVTVHSIALPESVRMVKGGTLLLEPVCKPSEVKDSELSWKSSNTAVATVSKGRVNAKRTGSVTVTVAAPNGKRAVCKIIIGDE